MTDLREINIRILDKIFYLKSLGNAADITSVTIGRIDYFDLKESSTNRLGGNFIEGPSGDLVLYGYKINISKKRDRYLRINKKWSDYRKFKHNVKILKAKQYDTGEHLFYRMPPHFSQAGIYLESPWA